jgi:hypothetical protein
MARDITAWCRDCQDSVRSKATVYALTAVQPIKVTDKRFSHFHVDLVGPLPTLSSGYTHLFTMVDRSTRWAEAVPVKLTSGQQLHGSPLFWLDSQVWCGVFIDLRQGCSVLL